MANDVTAFRALIQSEMRKQLLTRPRYQPTLVNTARHDETQELVIGGGTGDVSYCVVKTTIDWTPPES